MHFLSHFEPPSQITNYKLNNRESKSDMGLASASASPACASFSFTSTVATSTSTSTSTTKTPTLCRLHFSPTFPSPRKCNLNCQRSFRKGSAFQVSCSLLKVEDDVNDDACELVSGVELSIGDGDDTFDAYLLKAVKNNNGTAILLLSDIFGFEDSATRDFAYLVACNGYNVLVPDMFRGNPWTKDQPMTMLELWIAKQEPKRVAKDIDASVKWLVDEFSAAGVSKKLGVVGFCFGGGRVIEVLSRDQGICFGTGVSFYGTRMDPSLAPGVKVPVLFISGDNDQLCTVSTLKEFEKCVCQGSRVVIFEGRGHGFAHRPNSLDEDADAEEAFTIMKNWLHALVVEKLSSETSM